MADIDMIPRSYRDAMRARRTLAAYATALALLLSAGAGAAVLLRWRLAVEQPRLADLRAATAQTEALRARVAAAEARRDALAQDARALDGLRGGGAIASLSGALDATLGERIWLGELRFSRTHELLHDPLPAPLPEGAIALPAPGAAGTFQTWRLASHVELSGQALDHAALARFLQALSASPALGEVRFLNSSAGPAGDDASVSFSVAASLRQPRGTP